MNAYGFNIFRPLISALNQFCFPFFLLLYLVFALFNIANGNHTGLLICMISNDYNLRKSRRIIHSFKINSIQSREPNIARAALIKILRKFAFRKVRIYLTHRSHISIVYYARVPFTPRFIFLIKRRDFIRVPPGSKWNLHHRFFHLCAFVAHGVNIRGGRRRVKFEFTLTSHFLRPLSLSGLLAC
jgi:hypothetical protein